MPSIEDLRGTVARMEANLASDERATQLLASYRALVPRFAADLDDERDELLSRGAALMLIQEALAAPGRSARP